MRPLPFMAVLALALPLSAEEPKKAEPKKEEAKKADWSKVTAGHYEAEFPGKPTETEVKGGGKQYVLQAADPVRVYLSVANPFPAKVDVSEEKNVKAVLDQGVNTLAATLKGKVLSDKTTKYADKYPARDVDIEAPVIGIFRCRMVLTSGAYVQLTVAGPKEVVEGADARRFLDSLKIKE